MERGIVLILELVRGAITERDVAIRAMRVKETAQVFFKLDIQMVFVLLGLTIILFQSSTLIFHIV